MRPVEVLYEDGILEPEQPLALRSGERVGVMLVRKPDPARWDVARIAAAADDEDLELAVSGLDTWAADLEREDSR